MHKLICLRLINFNQLYVEDKKRIKYPLNKNHMVLCAWIKDLLIGYTILDSKKKAILDIYIYPNYRNINIGKRMVHTLLYLNLDLQGINNSFFKKIGFKNIKNKFKIDLNKLDLIESPYNVKYKSIWYNTYAKTVIKIENSEIKKELSKLVKLQFIIPLFTDFSCVFHYILQESIKNKSNSISLVTTTACNLNCNYCFEKNKDNVIIHDSKIYDEIWANFKNKIKNNFRLNFFGGEPTLNKKAIFYFTNKLRDYCKGKKYDYSLGMITNGTLCDKNFSNFFNDDEFTHIQITLDGPQKIHDSVRGKFDEILLNSKNILRITKSLGIRINITKFNFKYIPKLLSYLDNYYCFEEKSKIYLSFGFVYDVGKKINVNKKEYLKLQNYLEKNNFFGFKYFTEPKSRIIICSASLGQYHWFNLTGEKYFCEHLVGNKNNFVPTSYLNKSCFDCKYYPVCGGFCWHQDKTNEPKYPKCIRTQKGVEYYVKSIYNKENN